MTNNTGPMTKDNMVELKPCPFCAASMAADDITKPPFPFSAVCPNCLCYKILKELSMASFLSAPHFHNEAQAFSYVEARIWPEGPVCPHCGGVGKIGKLQGKTTRVGLWKCYQCRKPFTVRIGTIFQSSHLPLTVWLQAIFLVAGSKKGISANQLHRTLGITLKTAWFLAHRIREAMRTGELVQLGGYGGIVESDETYLGHKRDALPMAGGYAHKYRIVTLIDREAKQARSVDANKMEPNEVAYGPGADSRAEAIAAWNTRATMHGSDSGALREALLDARIAIDSLDEDELGQHPELGHFYRDELLAKIDAALNTEAR